MTLLLILLVCFVDAKVTGYSPFRDLNNTTLQGSGDASIVRRYTLWNRCTEKFVRIRKTGKKGVDARGRYIEAKYTTLKVKSVGQGGIVEIQGEESGLYLCFSKRGKLRARHKAKEYCKFYLKIVNDYNQFNLVLNPQWFVGFKGTGRKRRGKPLPGYKDLLNPRMGRCYDFYLMKVKDRTNGDRKPMKPGPFDFDKSDFDPEEPKLGDVLRNRKLRHRKSRRRKKHRRNNR